MKLQHLRLGPVPLLGLLTLVLAAGLAWMWVDEHARPRNISWVAPKALAPDLKVPVNSEAGPGAVANPNAYAVITARPIFAPDRRPPPPPAPPPPPDPLANVQVYGIFSGTTAGILVRVDGKVHRIKINEKIGPWTLNSIDGREIVFAQGEQKRTLRLAYARIDAPKPKPTVVIAPPVPPMSPAPTSERAAAIQQNAEERSREVLRRRNAQRAANGQPPIVLP
jgi:hypothetical protein